MSDFEIRRASSYDSDAIGLIMDAVWRESSPIIERIANVIINPRHETLVGAVNDRVVGFIDGFITHSSDGIRRWEVDLLAVHPDFQGMGIASALVEMHTRAGQNHGAQKARGLIAVGNVGSERAFERSGYETDATVHDLMVAGHKGEASAAELIGIMPHLVHVQTINYSGLWIEGQCTRAGLVDAMSRIGQSQIDVVGAVVSNIEIGLIQDATELGFECIGRYRWWLRPLVHD